MNFFDNISRFFGNLTGGFLGESDEERKRRLQREAVKNRPQAEKTYTPTGMTVDQFNPHREKVNSLLRDRYDYSSISNITGLDKKLVEDYGMNVLGEYWDEDEEISRESLKQAVAQDEGLSKKYQDYLNSSAWGQRKQRKELEKEIASFRPGAESDLEARVNELNRKRLLETLIQNDEFDEKSNILTKGADIGSQILGIPANVAKVGGQAIETFYDSPRIHNEIDSLNKLYKEGSIDYRTLKASVDQIAGGTLKWQHGVTFDDDAQELRKATAGEKIKNFSGQILETGSDAAMLLIPAINVAGATAKLAGKSLPMFLSNLGGNLTVNLPQKFTSNIAKSFIKQKLTEGLIYTTIEESGRALQDEPVNVQTIVMSFAANSLLDAGFDGLSQAVFAGIGKGLNKIMGKTPASQAGRLLTVEELKTLPPEVQLRYMRDITSRPDANGKMVSSFDDATIKEILDEMGRPIETKIPDGFMDDVRMPLQKVDYATGEYRPKTPAEAYIEWYSIKKLDGMTKQDVQILGELETYLKGFKDTAELVSSGKAPEGKFAKEVQAALEGKKNDMTAGGKKKSETRVNEMTKDVAPDVTPEGKTVDASGKAIETTTRVQGDEPIYSSGSNKTRKGGIDPVEIQERLRKRAESKILDEDGNKVRDAYESSEIKADKAKAASDSSLRQKIAEQIRGRDAKEVAKSIASRFGLDIGTVSRLIKKMNGNTVELIMRLSENGSSIKAANNSNAYATSLIDNLVKGKKPVLIDGKWQIVDDLKTTQAALKGPTSASPDMNVNRRSKPAPQVTKTPTKPVQATSSPKNANEVVYKLQHLEPADPSNFKSVSRSFDESRKVIGEYMDNVQKSIEAEYGWNKFVEDIYKASSPDESIHKKMPVKAKKLYDMYLGKLNQYTHATSKVTMGKYDLYYPQSYGGTSKKVRILGTLVDEIDSEFGHSKRRSNALAFENMDTSPDVMKRYFDQQFINRYGDQFKVAESTKVADELVRKQVSKEQASGKVVDAQRKATIAEQIRQTPDGQRTSQYFKAMNDLKKKLIQKSNKMASGDMVMDIQNKAAANKALSIVDELNSIGKREKLSQSTVETKLSKIYNLLNSADDIFSSSYVTSKDLRKLGKILAVTNVKNVKNKSSRSIDVLSGFYRYRNAIANSDNMFNRVFNVEYGKNVLGGKSVSQTRITTDFKKVSQKDIAKAIKDYAKDSKSSLTDKQLSNIANDGAKRIKQLSELVDNARSIDAKIVDDRLAHAMFKNEFAKTDRVIARNEFIEFNLRHNYANKNFKDLVEYHGQRMLLEDNIASSLIDDISYAVTGQITSGLLGLKPKSALYNFFEIKRGINEFGFIETGIATKMASENMFEILNRYGKAPTDWKNVTSHRMALETKTSNQFEAMFGKGRAKEISNVAQEYLDNIFDNKATTIYGKVKKVNRKARDIVMTPFKSAESFKDATLLQLYENVGKNKYKLEGPELTRFVLDNFEAKAIKQGEFGALGMSKNPIARLVTQFTPYSVKEARITYRVAKEMLQSGNREAQVAATKYMARWALTNTIQYAAIAQFFNVGFENIWGLQVPTGGPLVSLARNYYEYIVEMGNNEKMKALAEEAGEDYDESTYAKDKLTKMMAMFLPGGDQLLNKTGIHALTDKDSKTGKFLREIFPDGFLKNMEEGFNYSSRGRARFEMDQDMSGFEYFIGLLDGEYTTKNAREYFGSTDPKSGIPIIGRYFKGDKGYPAWKSVNDKINQANILKEKQSIFREFKDRVIEDKALEDAFLEAYKDDPQTIETYFKLNGKTLRTNKSEFERLAEKIGMGDIAREIDSLFNGPQESYYATEYNEDGTKKFSWISPEKWEMMKNPGVFEKRREDALKDNKRHGAFVDPIFNTLSDRAQINTIIQIRSMPSGDSEKLKSQLRESSPWYYEFEKREREYYENSSAYYEKLGLESKESQRVKDYLEASKPVDQPKLIAEYYRIRNEVGEDSAKAFSRANRESLNGEWAEYNQARLDRINKLREMEGYPPMTMEEFLPSQSTRGFGGYTKSSYSRASKEYNPYTGVANTIGRVRPGADELGLKKVKRGEREIVDPSKAFKKLRAKQVSKIRIKI